MNQPIKPPHGTTMNTTVGIVNHPAGKEKRIKIWIPAALALVFLFLIARGVLAAQPVNAQTIGDLPAEQNAVLPSTPTPTKQSTPTPSSAPSLAPVTYVKVYTDKFSLRTGPGLNYSTGRKLVYGEELLLVGRLDDNSWIYVKTSNGVEGWISSSWVRLGKIDLDAYAIQTPAPFPETNLKVLIDQTSLRTGPGNYYAKIRALSFDEQVKLLGRSSDRTWLYVETQDGQDGWVHIRGVNTAAINLQYDYYPVKTPPPTETSTPVILADVEGHWIDIDLSEQTLRAYDGTELMGAFLVSTGVDRYPTETGRYRIYVKYRSALMHGSDYYLPDVPYIMYYSGDFSIHGTYWHHNFGHPMSHGCVNMDTADAEWIFNWAPVGTLVNIHY